jgi:D-3-phosphoglycerate dehydrogenase
VSGGDPTARESGSGGPGRVLLPQNVAEEGKRYLLERGHEIRMGSGHSLEAMCRDIVDCDALLARLAPVPAQVLEASPRLKVVSRHGVGYDNVDVERATALGIWVTYGPESNAHTVAEHTLALILAAAKNLVPYDRELRRGVFRVRARLFGTDLLGKRLGIVGLGRIGRLVAAKASAGLGMEVVACTRTPDPGGLPPGVARLCGWEELFSTADVVSLHLPLVPETRGCVGGRELGWMKSSAFLINTARGQLVDEAALVEALARGRLAGAGLDVFAQEPPPEDHPLLRLQNVVLTAHSAALTRECLVRMAVDAARGIHEVLSGREPTWSVNRPEHPRNAGGSAAGS